MRRAWQEDKKDYLLFYKNGSMKLTLKHNPRGSRAVSTLEVFKEGLQSQ